MADWTWRPIDGWRPGYWVRHHGAYTAVIHRGFVRFERSAACPATCLRVGYDPDAKRDHGRWLVEEAPGANHPRDVARYSVGLTGPTGTERYVLRDSLDGARAKLAAALVRRQRAWEERQRGS